MGFRRILQVSCDNCYAGIDYFSDETVAQAKRRVRELGGVVQKDKVFCDQECCDKWWLKKTIGRLED